MRRETAKNWTWFRDAGAEALRVTEPTLRPLPDLLEQEDRLLIDLLHRPTSWTSGRPQDYVACVLSARAFRLCVAAVSISLSGYPDAAPNLTRSIWETCIRLLDLLDNPIAGALGYLSKGAADEIRSMKAELKHLLATGEPVGRLETNLGRWEDYYSRLRDAATSYGFDLLTIERKHGSLNMRQVCASHGAEKAYEVDYTFDSLFAHCHHASMNGLIGDHGRARLFLLGPDAGEAAGAVCDAIVRTARVLVLAATVVGDTDLVRRAESLLLDANKQST